MRAWGVVRTPLFEIDWPRAAVFSLGCILWEMLAGHPLFEGESDYETMMFAGAADVSPLHGVPAELELIVRKALAKHVDRRYQTVGDLGAALADYLAAGTVN
jgi:eukaryotic-like serine/threonine-protein kinase